MNAKLKIGIVSICFGALMIVGCSKKDSNNISNILTAEMGATIDGKAWNATLRETVKSSIGFVITGTQAKLPPELSSTVIITINGTTKGTYSAELLTTSKKCAATYTPDIVNNPSYSFGSISGSVIITEINTTNKTISGTFSFDCTNLSKSISITSGKFTGIGYTEVSGK